MVQQCNQTDPDNHQQSESVYQGPQDKAADGCIQCLEAGSSQEAWHISSKDELDSRPLVKTLGFLSRWQEESIRYLEGEEEVPVRQGSEATEASLQETD